jgi:hypothetical protein
LVTFAAMEGLSCSGGPICSPWVYYYINYIKIW